MKGQEVALERGHAPVATSHEPTRESAVAERVKRQDQGQIDPFTAARAHWVESYGGLMSDKRRWQAVALVSLLLAGGFGVGMAYLAGQSRLVPYVVEVNEHGVAIALKAADEAALPNGRVIFATLATFVEAWRAVYADGTAQKAAIFKVYALLAKDSPAHTAINEYFRADDKFKAARTGTLSAEVMSGLPLSDNTWQIEWQETPREAGAALAPTRWKAVLKYAVKPPTRLNAREADRAFKDNPMGIFVTDLSWGKTAP